MARPRKRRMLGFSPEATYFKPSGIPLRELEEVQLSMDELEALRLTDIEGLSQKDAAERMRVHQSTLNRTLASARAKLSDALVSGKAIRVSGGDFMIEDGSFVCPGCKKRVKHKPGQRCNTIICPACGCRMRRC